MVAAVVASAAAPRAAVTHHTRHPSIPAHPTHPDRGTLVLSDALNHTSIVAGVKASGATVKVFRHNNVRHLESLLRFHIAEGQPRTHRPWKKVRFCWSVGLCRGRLCRGRGADLREGAVQG